MYTDHKSLLPIFNDTRIGSVRAERICLRNQDIDFKLAYLPGSSNISDYFSRHPVPIQSLDPIIQKEADEHSKLLYTMSVCNYTACISDEELVKETSQDLVLSRLKLAILMGECPKNDELLRPFYKIFSELTIVDDIIKRGYKSVLPESLQVKAIDLVHKKGHIGITRLKQCVRGYYWFPRIDQLIEKRVQGCDCAIFVKDPIRNPITSAPTPDQPWQDVSLDLFGPMPDKYHILLARDNLSRFPAASIVNSTSAKAVIPALDRIYTDFGSPIIHKTDSGPPFNSKDFQDYSKDKNIIHKKTPPLHPQANEAEAFMKPLGKAMKLAHYKKLNKAQELNKFLSEYRSTPHSSTGVAPGDVLFRAGYHNGLSRAPPNPDIIQKVKESDKLTKEKNKEIVNNSRFTKWRPYIQGQLVRVRDCYRTSKFDPYCEPIPYYIVQVEGDFLELSRITDSRELIRHCDHVKVYASNESEVGNSNDTSFDFSVDIDEEFDEVRVPVVGEVPEVQDVPRNQIAPVVEWRSQRPRTSTRDTIYRDFEQ